MPRWMSARDITSTDVSEKRGMTGVGLKSRPMSPHLYAETFEVFDGTSVETFYILSDDGSDEESFLTQSVRKNM